MKRLSLILLCCLPLLAMAQTQAARLAEAARSIENPDIIYDASYFVIPYPNGDVPDSIGVCTDVVIRAFRKGLGIDLQKEVHDFRIANGQKSDTNIDHRRVRGLMAYFDAQTNLTRCATSGPYRAGDIIIWHLGGHQLHIGLFISPTLIIHNMGWGQLIEPIADMGDTPILRVYRFK